MQFKTFKQLAHLKTPAVLLNGLLDFFIIRRINHRAVRANRRYLRSKTLLGPHELTPRSGRRIARVIMRYTIRYEGIDSSI